MPTLTLSYFADGSTESRVVSLRDATAEPELSKHVKAAKDELAKLDVMVAWFTKNPRKMACVDLGGVEEPAARRITKLFAPPALKLSVESLKGDWLAEHAAILEDLEIDDLTAFDVATLAKLPRLRRLGLWHRDKLDLSFLTKLPALAELRLGGFEQLKLPKLPRIRELFLERAELKDGALAGLTGLTKLRVHDVTLGEPGALPALEAMFYEYHREPLSKNFFKGTPALKSVGGNLLNLPDDDNLIKLDILAPCSALEEIDLSMHNVSRLGVLATLPRLTSFSLSADTPS